jgi:hypothetical protein
MKSARHACTLESLIRKRLFLVMSYKFRAIHNAAPAILIILGGFLYIIEIKYPDSGAKTLVALCILIGLLLQIRYLYEIYRR